MVPSFDVLVRIPRASPLGKQPLPAPFAGGIPVFPPLGIEQFLAASTCREIGLVLVLHLFVGHFNGSTRLDHRTVRLPLSHLPQRTLMQRCSRSTSLIRRRSASMSLRPLP